MKKLFMVSLLCIIASLTTSCSTADRKDAGMIAGGVVGGITGSVITAGSVPGAVAGVIGGAFIGRQVVR